MALTGTAALGDSPSSAPQAVDLDEFFADQDKVIGNAGTGYMLGDDVSFANRDNVTDVNGVTYTDFYTQGGDGSGGGAGMGGVFFVNDDGSLTLSDVQITGNVVRGGVGGGEPDVDYSGIEVALTEREASGGVNAVYHPAPVLVGAADTFSSVTLDNESALVKVGQRVKVDGAAGSTTVSGITENDDGTVTLAFDSSLTLDADSKYTITGGANAAELSIDNNVDDSGSSITGSILENLASDVNFAVGATVVGTGLSDGTRVVSIERDGDDNITEIVLDKPLASGTSLVAGDLKVVALGSVDMAQFEVLADNQIQMQASAVGLSVGMEVEGEGIPTGTRILSIVAGDDGDTVTLSNDLSNSGNDTFSFVGKSEIRPTVDGVKGKHIQLATPDSSFNVGDTIAGDNIPSGTTIVAYDAATGLMEVSNTITADPELLASTPVKSVSGDVITLSSVDGIKKGQRVRGDGFAEGAVVTAVDTVNKTVTVKVPVFVLGEGTGFDPGVTGTVTGIVLSSSLSEGGTLNGVTQGSSKPEGGENGTEASVLLPVATDGEGLDGFAGEDGDDATSAQNANGARGGSGSSGTNGVPFNTELLIDVATDGVELGIALSEAAAAYGNLATVNIGASKTAAIVAAGLNLSQSVSESILWLNALSLGQVATGGDGGAGGDGGVGGRGGFGAGGGSGGAAGLGGSTGNAKDGTPGAGGREGFGGGEGSDGTNSFGGGGAGYGGAIFIRGDGTDGGLVTISGNALIRDNVAIGGSSTNRGMAGQAAGANIFIMRGGTLNLTPGAGKTIRIEGGIADDSLASITGASWTSGDGADINVGGGGLVQLSGENTYSGKTYIRGATLEAVLDASIHEDSSVVFEGSGTLTGAGGLYPHVTAGALMVSDDVTRRLGTIVPGQISWNGAGGFAAGTTDGITLNFGRCRIIPARDKRSSGVQAI